MRALPAMAAALLAAWPAPGGSTATGPAGREELIVFAASSLREAFTALAAQFEARHPGVRVRLSFAGSQELRAQVENGAPADVFASADVRHLAALRDEQLAGPATIFARNEPVLVVPRDNPAGLRGLEDLPRARHIVLGDPQVPIGEYSARILDAGPGGKAFRAQVEAHVVSRELNVRQVLAKVALGEADAAIVYRTDALAAKGQVLALPIPAGINARADYPLAVLTRARAPALAAQFVALVLSADGQSALAARGFSPGAPR